MSPMRRRGSARRGWRPGRSSSKTTRSWNSRAARSRRSMASCSSTAQMRASPTPARLGSNSALTGLTSVTGNFFLQNGATVTTTGDLSVTGNGTVELDGPYAGGSGGTSLTIGGKLTNSSTNGYGVYVGNTSITSADTLTVNGTGGLSNTGDINIIGQRHRPGDPECRQCGGGVRHEGGGDRDGRPRKRRAPGIQERPDHDGQWRAAARRRECRASPTPARLAATAR